MLTNHRYGFHRDELAVIDDARHLAWGYVAYPPVTPFIARLALELFGPSLVGIRLFSALAQSVVIILTGLMARRLGGSLFAQALGAAAVAIAPIFVIEGALFQYVSFDLLWSVLIAYLMIRLLESDDRRWWLAIGVTIGVGMLTRYTMAFFVAGLVAGVLLTPARRHLRSGWLWGGVVVSVLIFLPNLIWQIEHDFVSVEFLRNIHERDVRVGRTEGFLIEQLFVPANPFTIPLWLSGLYVYLFSRHGQRYRALGWLYLVPLILFVVMKGRSYYLAPAYPMLLAAGAIVWERAVSGFRPSMRKTAIATTIVLLIAGAAMSAVLMLPLAPVNSKLWNVVSGVHDNFVEEIGWQELVATIAAIYANLPPQERSRTAVLVANYGEAGALNLYGPGHGLPQAISGINSYWARGYGWSPPETLIVVGFSRERAERFFRLCEVAARVTNAYGVVNEESREPNEIFICRNARLPWPMRWRELRSFG